MSESEVLHGIRVQQNTVTVTVTSNGCTGPGDFEIKVAKSNPPIATWIRKRPDPCKMISHSVDLEFSRKLIGKLPFKVGNTFAPGPPRLGSIALDKH